MASEVSSGQGGDLVRLQKMIMIERLSSRLGALECLPEVAGDFEPQWSLIGKKVVTKAKKSFVTGEDKYRRKRKSDCREHARVPRKKGR